MEAGGWLVGPADLAEAVGVESEQARRARAPAMRPLRAQGGRAASGAASRRTSPSRGTARWAGRDSRSCGGPLGRTSGRRPGGARRVPMPRSASVVPFGRPSSIHSSTSNGGSSDTASTSGTGTTRGSRNQLSPAASVVKKPGGAAGCVFAKTRRPSERSIAKDAATSPPCTLDASTTLTPRACSTSSRKVRRPTRGRAAAS